MSLRPGSYIIRSATKSGNTIGRSSNPQDPSIQVLPRNSSPVIWTVEPDPAGENQFTFKINGIATSNVGGIVSATEDVPPQAWHVEHVPHHGDNQYLIKNKEEDKAWFVPNEEPTTKVTLDFIIVAPSIPPQFRDSQRWIMEPLLD